ncbi:class I SAM-dependent methyltransferase [bacterium]|nr:class I SAM-dependent methyltransferase [bacterium]
MEQKKYLSIVSYYESCLEKYGDSYLGVDWPKQEDVDTRYRVMLQVMRPETPNPVKLLDFGCGASHLYEYILRTNASHIIYSGLDVSPKFIELSKRKFPSVNYYCLDVLDHTGDFPNFDYVVLNGVFTEKRDLTFDEMLAYFTAVLNTVFQKANYGIAFNVMSKHVDWEREDLFHLPFDTLAAFLSRELSRDFVIRNDYGLYEYTTYVYK